jgi:hypothetical protein
MVKKSGYPAPAPRTATLISFRYRMDTPLQVTEAVLIHAGSRAGIAGVYQLHDYSHEKAEALDAWGTTSWRLWASGP